MPPPTSGPLQRLNDALSRLPSLGRRSAERITYRLVRDKKLAEELHAALGQLIDQVRLCPRCGNVSTRSEEQCSICRDPKRNPKQLCVVEQPDDILRIEQTEAFHGQYHALLGKLSSMRGEGPRSIRLRKLLDRIRNEHITEVLLAFNTDVESDATSHMLRELLAAENVKVSHLAWGLPVGSGLAYTDPITLARAIAGRQDMP